MYENNENNTGVRNQFWKFSSDFLFRFYLLVLKITKVLTQFITAVLYFSFTVCSSFSAVPLMVLKVIVIIHLIIMILKVMITVIIINIKNNNNNNNNGMIRPASYTQTKSVRSSNS